MTARHNMPRGDAVQRIMEEHKFAVLYDRDEHVWAVYDCTGETTYRGELYIDTSASLVTEHADLGTALEQAVAEKAKRKATTNHRHTPPPGIGSPA